MIFDGKSAKAIYARFYNKYDSKELDLLLQYCDPLVEAIASDLSSDDTHREDLIQEGRIKLLKLFNGRKFKPNGRESGGDFHSWLSYALRNCMIDYLRKQRSHLELLEDIPYNFTKPAVDTSAAVVDWAVMRFPFLPNLLIADAALYLHDALRENVHRQSIGILTTLQVTYGVDTKLGKLLYHSIRTYLQVGDSGHADHALLIAKESEYSNTLIPELILLLGKDTAITVLLTFKNCKLLQF